MTNKSLHPLMPHLCKFRIPMRRITFVLRKKRFFSSLSTMPNNFHKFPQIHWCVCSSFVFFSIFHSLGRIGFTKTWFNWIENEDTKIAATAVSTFVIVFVGKAFFAHFNDPIYCQTTISCWFAILWIFILREREREKKMAYFPYAQYSHRIHCIVFRSITLFHATAHLSHSRLPYYFAD